MRLKLKARVLRLVCLIWVMLDVQIFWILECKLMRLSCTVFLRFLKIYWHSLTLILAYYWFFNIFGYKNGLLLLTLLFQPFVRHIAHLKFHQLRSIQSSILIFLVLESSFKKFVFLITIFVMIRVNLSMFVYFLF